MDGEIFESWLNHHFLLYAPPARPLFLLMDGHSCHFSPVFVNKAADEQVIVFCLPPHSTHKTQPLDKVFSPLKKVWAEACHSYMVNNPGKIVTRYQFSFLFNHAWMKAMTPNNIIAGFRVTGVYPVDRHKILPKSPPKPPTMCERSGLKFIPLFTPLRQSMRSPVYSPTSVSTPIFDESIPPYSENESLAEPFTHEEIAVFSRRKEEGYDITTDRRYNLWLSLQLGEKSEVPRPSSHSVVSRLISSLPPVTKNRSFLPKSTARVVTSLECCREINEKERKKAEALKLKEERKVLCEQKQEERRKNLQEKSQKKIGIR